MSVWYEFVTRRLSRCIFSRVVSPPAASHRGASHLGCSNSARGELPLHSLRFGQTCLTYKPRVPARRAVSESETGLPSRVFLCSCSRPWMFSWRPLNLVQRRTRFKGRHEAPQEREQEHQGPPEAALTAPEVRFKRRSDFTVS